jgi:hypothetical protein
MSFEGAPPIAETGLPIRPASARQSLAQEYGDMLANANNSNQSELAEVELDATADDEDQDSDPDLSGYVRPQLDAPTEEPSPDTTATDAELAHQYTELGYEANVLPDDLTADTAEEVSESIDSSEKLGEEVKLDEKGLDYTQAALDDYLANAVTATEQNISAWQQDPETASAYLQQSEEFANAVRAADTLTELKERLSDGGSITDKDAKLVQSLTDAIAKAEITIPMSTLSAETGPSDSTQTQLHIEQVERTQSDEEMLEPEPEDSPLVGRPRGSLAPVGLDPKEGDQIGITANGRQIQRTNELTNNWPAEADADRLQLQRRLYGPEVANDMEALRKMADARRNSTEVRSSVFTPKSLRATAEREEVHHHTEFDPTTAAPEALQANDAEWPQVAVDQIILDVESVASQSRGAWSKFVHRLTKGNGFVYGCGNRPFNQFVALCDPAKNSMTQIKETVLKPVDVDYNTFNAWRDRLDDMIDIQDEYDMPILNKGGTPPVRSFSEVAELYARRMLTLERGSAMGHYLQ